MELSGRTDKAHRAAGRRIIRARYGRPSGRRIVHIKARGHGGIQGHRERGRTVTLGDGYIINRDTRRIIIIDRDCLLLRTRFRAIRNTRDIYYYSLITLCDRIINSRNSNTAARTTRADNNLAARCCIIGTPTRRGTTISQVDGDIT